MMASHKTTQYWLVALKVLVLVLAFGYLFYKIRSDGSSLAPIISQSFKDVSMLLPVSFLGLAMCNWLLEILRWKVSVNTTYSLSFLGATKQSLGSLTASLITPNRIGEYGAKALYYLPEKRKKIVLLNFVYGSSQLVATLLFGIPAVVYFIFTYGVSIAVNRGLIFVFILLVLVILGYVFRKKQLGIKGLSLQNMWTHFKRLPKTSLFQILVLSVMRYLIFSTLFYLLLIFFGATSSYVEAAPVIFSMYLLVSIIPSFFVLDVVIRGGVSLWLFSFLDIPDMTVLATVFIMWILNVVLPAILGGYYVFTFKPQQQ